jgi:hypothetical protein
MLHGAGWWMPHPSSLPQGKSHYPLYRRLDGPQGRFGQEQKILPPPEFDPWTVQPVASLYTNYAILPHFQMQVFINIASSSCSALVVMILTFWVCVVSCRVLLLGWIGPYPDEGQVSSLHFIHTTFDHFHVLSTTVCVHIFRINWTPPLHAEYLLNCPSSKRTILIGAFTLYVHVWCDISPFSASIVSFLLIKDF